VEEDGQVISQWLAWLPDRTQGRELGEPINHITLNQASVPPQEHGVVMASSLAI
jgi:hypothetical protein